VSRLRVAVLAGGRSSEHEISVASARSVAEGLERVGYDPVVVEIDREGGWRLPPSPQAAALEGDGGAHGELPAERPGRVPVPAAGTPSPFGAVDVVFPALHGPFGEDGTVQGLLELADVPYVGPGVAASAVAMDKDLFKAVMRANGVPVTRSVTVLARARDRAVHDFGYPVVVKPARLGSSVGISLVRSADDLTGALDLAFAHDEKVLVEEYVDGIEIECSVLGNEEPFASVVGEIVPLKADWYDFASKYDEGGMELVVPARIPAEQAARAQELAVLPGFTATSVYAKLLEASGIGYEQLLRRLVDLALERHERRRRLRY
jgi:D-alanine-D-alanine ligase